MLVYIHVPFCRTKCRYCSFFSFPLGKGMAAERAPALLDYVEKLLSEIDLWKERLGRFEIESVFFGGGTPSLLAPSTINKILSRLQANFAFAEKPEITLEANPESLRSGLTIRNMLSAGINRLSIGIQSMEDNMLRQLGRLHKSSDSLHTVFSAREAGCSNISVDLMWGLPGQSVRNWLQTLKEIARITPEHISTYCLTLDNDTPLGTDCAQGKLSLPPERDQSIMFVEGAALLESNGYIHYEISNFAKMGFHCRHNLGYWEGRDYLGIGPSATSTIAGRRWTNPANLEEWSNAVRDDNLDAHAESLKPMVKILEMIMLRLRTAKGMNLETYRKLTGRDFLRDNRRMIQAMHENDLIRIRNGYFSLTRSGMLVSNSIISNLFDQTKSVLAGALPE